MLGADASSEFEADAEVVERSRNFYGVLTVTDELTGTPGHMVKLHHGRILHGLQFVHAARTLFPTSYYGGLSGGALALRAFPRQGARRIGLIGLGVGTLTAYSRPGEYVRIYEINPEVVRLAETRFTFLSHAAAEVDIVMGDARLSMEREDPQEFDVLLLDAFNSDAIPVHLLTVEAFETYLTHLRLDGVLAVHISNRHLELKPVVARLAEHFGLEYVQIINEEENARGVFAADWMLLTSNLEFLAHPAIRSATVPDANDVTAVALWTDDYVNILEIVSSQRVNGDENDRGAVGSPKWSLLCVEAVPEHHQHWHETKRTKRDSLARNFSNSPV